MKKSTVFNLNKNKMYGELKANSILIILSLLYICGILVGTLAVKNNQSVSDFAKYIFNSFFLSRIGQSFFKILIFSFLFSFIFVFLIYVSGVSAIGITTIPIVIFARGIISGIISGYIYSDYGFNGVAFNLILVIPATVVSVVGLVDLSQTAMNFSYGIGKIIISNSNKDSNFFEITKYNKVLLYTSLVTLISSLIDAATSAAFINFFEMG